jgi:hypothetical protein
VRSLPRHRLFACRLPSGQLANPREAKRRALAIVNRQPTEHDFYADIVLNAEFGPTLKAIVSLE